MPNGTSNINFSEIFQKLGLGGAYAEKYLPLVEDPGGYFDFGEKYDKFFPGAEIYREQFTKLFGGGEGSLAEKERTLLGDVAEKYRLGSEAETEKYRLGTESAEQRYEIGTEQAQTTGTQQLLNLVGQLKKMGTKFAGFGAKERLEGTTREDIGEQYATTRDVLGRQKEQTFDVLGTQKEQAFDILGAQKERGTRLVGDEMERLLGGAQSLWGDYIASLLGAGTNIMASFPTNLMAGGGMTTGGTSWGGAPPSGAAEWSPFGGV